ncbi:hypothetical protein [Tengunoibacter tsumagoiensis]|uniref:Uncharacterized protein n=1 Tax=Tengunoibacter tsumagoiensis TaxID=2014871 RepID=A0A402A833_9CHLR|nr:hypothetical protein [Tengunoibacter tsumagoiensis]GCE15327.1 hypothetical protein KTT_51860 [Tengunoibacter tsumagoiensis]
MPMRRPLYPADEKHRSDKGSYKYTSRDHKALLFVAQQKFVCFDQLGQFLAPDLSPATEIPHSSEEGAPLHGGRRSHLHWPQDRRKRIHAVAELARRWQNKMGFVDVWQPWSHEPPWLRITQSGLLNLGLDWNELPFPEDRNRLTLTSHTYHITKRRLFLANGGSHAPAHRWISERAIEAHQIKEGGVKIPHRPDGVMELLEEGMFPIIRNGSLIEEVPLAPGQHVAIEIELTQKKFDRLGEHILPSLLNNYDFAWYYCGKKEVYDALVTARRAYLQTDEERKRLRIFLLEEKGQEIG